MSTYFEIVKITDKKGNDRLDGRYPLRSGRRCKPLLYGCNNVCFLEYYPREGEDYFGTLRTSLVEEIESKNGELKITTLNSIYYLKELAD
jgi:hypothetical protein